MTGIIFLIIATVCAAMFSISFKIFQRFNIDSHQAIFFNYMTAFILGVLFSLNGEMVVNPIKADWFIPVIFLGLIFMAGMVVLSDSTRRVGVAISTVCSRASMGTPLLQGETAEPLGLRHKGRSGAQASAQSQGVL